MNTLEFFKMLFAECEGKSYIWTMPDKMTRQAGDTETLSRFAAECDRAGKNVYFSVGVTDKELKPYERAKNTDITGIPGLWADIDIAGNGHAATNLPPDYQAACDLLPANFSPSVVVFSGHGIHAYYLFREMLDTRTDEERKFATDLLRRLQGIIRRNAATKGWQVDSVPDLCRVLRVPYTMNRKNGGAAKCEVAEWNDDRYNPSDFDDALPDVEEQTDSGRRAKFERRETDGAATLMLENCAFLRYWRENYRTLPEPVWKAACGNIIRGVGGEDVIIPIVKEWQGAKYDERATLQKLKHYLTGTEPVTCAYIKNELHFAGCTDCGVKSPCAWSLAKIPQAIAKIRAVDVPTIENTLQNKEIMSALAVVKRENVAEYAKFEARCKGRVNLNLLKQEVKKTSGGKILAEGQDARTLTTKSNVENTPVDLVIPPNFAYDENGIYEIRHTEYGIKSTLAAGQPVIIVAKIRNRYTGTEKIKLAFLYGERWKEIVVKRSEIFSTRTIVNMADTGLMVSSESAKPLVRYLQVLETMNRERIPTIEAVSRIGWQDDTLKNFILPSLAKDVYIDIADDGDITSAYKTSGTLAEWLTFARTIREHTYGRFMLAASFAAPLLKIFNERNFMLYYWGTSGGAKTAAMYFAMSVWGDPARLIRSFYGTTNGIERAAEYSNDFPLAINERQVMMGNNRQESLETLVYMLEGGRGKVRASKTGLRQMATWRTISLSTGEEPLSKETSVQGIKTRLLEINAFPVLPNELGKSVYSFTAQNHGTAGIAYIEQLLREQDNGYTEIYKARQSLRVRLQNDFPDVLDPHIDAITLICTADFLANRWLFGAESKAAAQDTYNLAAKIAAEMPTKRDVSDTERAWEFVSEWLASNKRRFETAEYDDNGPKITPSYGFIKNGFYNIYPSYLTDALEKAGYRANKLLKEFADKGLIETREEQERRQYKTVVKYGGATMRVVKIKFL